MLALLFLNSAAWLTQQVACSPSSISSVVRTPHVLEYLHGIGHDISWITLDEHVKYAAFNELEWASWEDNARVNGSASVVFGPTSRNFQVRAATAHQAVGDDDRSVVCYRSGSCVHDATPAAMAGGACRAFTEGLDRGATQLVASYRGYNEAGDPMSGVFKVVKMGAKWMGTAACTSVIKSFVNDQCQGKNDDTRGGETKGHFDQISIDPTTDNCNC